MGLAELSVMEQRFHAVMECLGGTPKTEVANRYGVSRQTIHTWLARYAADGLKGLDDRSHRPHDCPHRVDPEIGGVGVRAAPRPSPVGSAPAAVRGRPPRDHATAGPGNRVPDPAPQQPGPRRAAQAAPGRISAVGTAGADGAVADGHRRRRATRRRHRGEGGHRPGRPLPVLRDRHGGAPGHRPRRVRRVRRRAGPVRGAG